MCNDVLEKGEGWMMAQGGELTLCNTGCFIRVELFFLLHYGATFMGMNCVKRNILDAIFAWMGTAFLLVNRNDRDVRQDKLNW